MTLKYGFFRIKLTHYHPLTKMEYIKKRGRWMFYGSRKFKIGWVESGMNTGFVEIKL